MCVGGGGGGYTHRNLDTVLKAKGVHAKSG